MSAEILAVRDPDGTAQGTMMGGSKPLHRFLKGQPKVIGTVVLILGVSFISVTIAYINYSSLMSSVIPPGILLGILFIISGILFIVTEHNPTKRKVTMSLALSIVSILATCWTILRILRDISLAYEFSHYEHEDLSYNETETPWMSYYYAMGMSIEAVFLLYSFVGAIIFIVMSALAGAALRSTKSQAVVVMTTTAAETPVE